MSKERDMRRTDWKRITKRRYVSRGKAIHPDFSMGSRLTCRNNVRTVYNLLLRTALIVLRGTNTEKGAKTECERSAGREDLFAKRPTPNGSKGLVADADSVECDQRDPLQDIVNFVIKLHCALPPKNVLFLICSSYFSSR